MERVAYLAMVTWAYYQRSNSMQACVALLQQSWRRLKSVLCARQFPLTESVQASMPYAIRGHTAQKSRATWRVVHLEPPLKHSPCRCKMMQVYHITLIYGISCCWISFILEFLKAGTGQDFSRTMDRSIVFVFPWSLIIDWCRLRLLVCVNVAPNTFDSWLRFQLTTLDSIYGAAMTVRDASCCYGKHSVFQGDILRAPSSCMWVSTALKPGGIWVDGLMFKKLCRVVLFSRNNYNLPHYNIVIFYA